MMTRKVEKTLEIVPSGFVWLARVRTAITRIAGALAATRAGLRAMMPSSRVALLLEARQHRAFQLAPARQLDAHRIDEAAVDADLVMHVRAGRQAGRADEADHLALAHVLAFVDAAREGAHVAIGGLVAVGVADAG